MKKNPIKLVLLVVLLLLAVVLGKLLGNACAHISFLSWLGTEVKFALIPTTLDLVVLSLTFGMQVGLNVAQGIFLVIAVLVTIFVRIKG